MSASIPTPFGKATSIQTFERFLRASGFFAAGGADLTIESVSLSVKAIKTYWHADLTEEQIISYFSSGSKASPEEVIEDIKKIAEDNALVVKVVCQSVLTFAMNCANTVLDERFVNHKGTQEVANHFDVSVAEQVANVKQQLQEFVNFRLKHQMK